MIRDINNLLAGAMVALFLTDHALAAVGVWVVMALANLIDGWFPSESPL